jgi:hypothetical protein
MEEEDDDEAAGDGEDPMDHYPGPPRLNGTSS